MTDWKPIPRLVHSLARLSKRPEIPWGLTRLAYDPTVHDHPHLATQPNEYHQSSCGLRFHGLDPSPSFIARFVPRFDFGSQSARDFTWVESYFYVRPLGNTMIGLWNYHPISHDSWNTNFRTHSTDLP